MRGKYNHIDKEMSDATYHKELENLTIFIEYDFLVKENFNYHISNLS